MKNTVSSRRTFSKAQAAAPWVLRAQPGESRGRIKIDTERVIDDDGTVRFLLKTCQCPAS